MATHRCIIINVNYLSVSTVRCLDCTSHKVAGLSLSSNFTRTVSSMIKQIQKNRTLWQFRRVYSFWAIVKINLHRPIKWHTITSFWGICFAVCHDCPVPIHKVFLAIAFRVRTLLTSATFRPYSGAEKAAPIVTQVFLQLETLWDSGNDDKVLLYRCKKFCKVCKHVNNKLMEAGFKQTWTSWQNLYWSGLSSETLGLLTPLKFSAGSSLWCLLLH